MTTHLPRRISQVTVQHIGPETLVYDERRHQAFCLNPTSAALWNLADGTRTVAQLAAQASLQLAAPVTTEIVELALAGFERDGLLAASLPAPGEFQVPAALSRRAVMGSLGAASLVLLPAVVAVIAPRAAQAYTGCFDCSTAATPTAAAAAQRRAQAQDATTKAAAARKTRQATPESSPESSFYKPR